VEVSNTTSPARNQLAVVRARITGNNTCSALGITVRAAAPVLALCRKLIEARQDPATPLEAYRGDMLCLQVRSIGEGAQLTVYEEPDLRFARWKPFSSLAVPPRIRAPAGALH
jgi:hypothetical protein